MIFQNQNTKSIDYLNYNFSLVCLRTTQALELYANLCILSFKGTINSPSYSCMLDCQAFEKQRG